MQNQTYSLITESKKSDLTALFEKWFEQIRHEYVALLIDCGGDASSLRWYVRIKGQVREAITVWFFLNQRSLSVETQFMPAPEVNIEKCLSYLLVKNNSLKQVHFSIGFENAIYLVGSIPANLITTEALDEMLGAAYQYVEDYFAVAMTIGYEGKYRYSRSGK